METLILEKRDAVLQTIRPEVSYETSVQNDIEDFQNQTLRPILKFQNDLILAQFKEYLEKHKTKFYTFNREAQRDFVRDVLRSDLSIRNLLVPMVIGFFTLEEFAFFKEHRSQISKRTLNLIVRRIQDQVEKLY